LAPALAALRSAWEAAGAMVETAGVFVVACGLAAHVEALKGR
jgi:hypothetical protein